MYKPENFTLKELAHPRIIRAIGEVNTWRRLDAGALRDLQKVRNKWYARTGYGIYVNRLDIGLDSRGLRPPNDEDGSFYSTHKQGGTFDLEPIVGKIVDLYNMIIQMIKEGELERFNTLEDIDFTPTWVHVGCMNTDEKPLIIKPRGQ